MQTKINFGEKGFIIKTLFYGLLLFYVYALMWMNKWMN